LSSATENPRPSEAEEARVAPPTFVPTFAIGLFAIAFVARLAAAFTLAGEPVWDGHYYDFGARRIAGGHGYSDERVVDGHAVWHPWCHYPVGYSGYLALFYKAFGASASVAHVANALAGALLALVVYLLAREALSEKRSRLAGGLVALNPGLLLWGGLVMSEPLAALLTMTAFLVTLRVGKARGPVWGAAAGAIVLGVAVLVRPQALLCAPFLTLAPARAASSIRLRRATPAFGRSSTPTAPAIRTRLAALAAACALVLVPVLPWTARNCNVMDGCALVSTNAGWNLAIGSFPRATGRFETLRSSDGCAEVTGQVQQDRCWLGYGWMHIKRTPGRWLSLVPTKLSQTFDHESFAVEYLREARPTAWPEPRRVAWRTVLTAAHRILVAAAALGFVAFALPRRSNARPAFARSGPRLQTALLAVLAIGALVAFSADAPTFWPVALAAAFLPWLPLPGRPPPEPALLMPVALFATTIVAHAIFFGEDRYHMVLTPVLCLLAAAALRAPAPAKRTPDVSDAA